MSSRLLSLAKLAGSKNNAGTDDLKNGEEGIDISME